MSVFVTVPLYVTSSGEKVKNFTSELYRKCKPLKADWIRTVPFFLKTGFI